MSLRGVLGREGRTFFSGLPLAERRMLFKMRSSPPAAPLARQAGPSPAQGNRWRIGPLRAHDVQIYHICEALTEVVIYLMVVFSPWAFGTTQRWSIWTMNIAGYALGLLLAVKLAMRWLKGYCPARWDEPTEWRTGSPRRNATELSVASESSSPMRSKLTGLLAGLTFAILGYCMVSAVNARA